MYEGDYDSNSEEEFEFLSEEELKAWHKAMRKAFPQVFKKKDPLYGPFHGQHPLGQKLMTYFDQDPNQPMKCVVQGSRMIYEDVGRGITMTPVYVVLMEGAREPTQISWTSAHEKRWGWWRGWDVPSPTSNGFPSIRKD
jgi:hypothetical protein